MTIDSPLDPRHARLVALLYDELPPAEAVALRAELASDDALRAEWDELNATRGLLGAWQIEERTPSFVFLEPPAAGAMGKPRPSPVRGGRALLTWGGWAIAAAALLFVGVAGRGARFERLENGFAVRLGPGPAERVGGAPPRASLASVALPRRHTSALGDQLPPMDAAFQVSYHGELPPVGGGSRASEAGFVTRSDMDAHTDQMVSLVAQLLNEDRVRRDREVTSMLRSVYGDLNDRQFAGYRDLRGRIEAVNVGLLLGRSADGVNPDGSSVAAPADTLRLKSRVKQPGQHNWKYGDYADEPERF